MLILILSLQIISFNSSNYLQQFLAMIILKLMIPLTSETKITMKKIYISVVYGDESSKLALNSRRLLRNHKKTSNNKMSFNSRL